MITSSAEPALEEATQWFQELLPNPISAVVVFGGVARGEFLPGWSDLDLLVISQSIDQSVRDSMLAIRKRLRWNFGLRSDIVLHTEAEVETRPGPHCLLGSLAMNALSGRPGTGAVIFGEVDLYPVGAETEQRAALDYVTQIAYRLRKLFLDAGMSPIDEPVVLMLARAIRWTSSVLRCALRARGIHSLPYDALLNPLRGSFPGLSLNCLREAFELRRDWERISPSAAAAMTERLAEFIETFLARFHQATKGCVR